MKFTAIGKTGNSLVAMSVVSAFFENFNVDSYIGIKNGRIELEIFFEEDKLPTKIAEALGDCEEIEFTYGQPSSEMSDSKTKIEPDPKGVNEESLQEVKKKTEMKEETEASQIIESRLNTLANGSETFEDFLEKIEKWFDLGKRKKFFENVIMVMVESPSKKWKDIYLVFDERKISYATWETTQLSSKISKKLDTADKLPLFKLLQKIASYKKVFLINSEGSGTEEKSSGEESMGEVSQSSTSEERKKERLPEIAEFNEQLEKTDKNATGKEKAEYVFNLMKIGKNLEKVEKLFMDNMIRIIEKSVENRETDITNVIISTEISNPDIFTLQMQFSTFINNYFEHFYPDTKVRTSDFLEYLIKVLTE